MSLPPSSSPHLLAMTERQAYTSSLTKPRVEARFLDLVLNPIPRYHVRSSFPPLRVPLLFHSVSILVLNRERRDRSEKITNSFVFPPSLSNSIHGTIADLTFSIRFPGFSFSFLLLDTLPLNRPLSGLGYYGFTVYPPPPLARPLFSIPSSPPSLPKPTTFLTLNFIDGSRRFRRRRPRLYRPCMNTSFSSPTAPNSKRCFSFPLLSPFLLLFPSLPCALTPAPFPLSVAVVYLARSFRKLRRLFNNHDDDDGRREERQ